MVAVHVMMAGLERIVNSMVALVTESALTVLAHLPTSASVVPTTHIVITSLVLTVIHRDPI
jgi:hypothetical protein